MDDEVVKVRCEEFDCKFNLFLKQKRSCCKLKYITIGADKIGLNGRSGTCQEMEFD